MARPAPGSGTCAARCGCRARTSPILSHLPDGGVRQNGHRRLATAATRRSRAPPRGRPRRHSACRLLPFRCTRAHGPPTAATTSARASRVGARSSVGGRATRTRSTMSHGARSLSAHASTRHGHPLTWTPARPGAEPSGSLLTLVRARRVASSILDRAVATGAADGGEDRCSPCPSQVRLASSRSRSSFRSRTTCATAR